LAWPMEGATRAPVMTKRQVTRFWVSHSHV